MFVCTVDSAWPLTYIDSVCVRQAVGETFPAAGRAPPAVHLHPTVSCRTGRTSSSGQMLVVDSLGDQSARPVQCVAQTQPHTHTRLSYSEAADLTSVPSPPLLRCSQQHLLTSHHAFHRLLQHHSGAHRLHGGVQDLAELRQLQQVRARPRSSSLTHGRSSVIQGKSWLSFGPFQAQIN